MWPGLVERRRVVYGYAAQLGVGIEAKIAELQGMAYAEALRVVGERQGWNERRSPLFCLLLSDSSCRYFHEAMSDLPRHPGIAVAERVVDFALVR